MPSKEKIYNDGAGIGGGAKEESTNFLKLGNWSKDLPDQYAVRITDKRPKVYTDAAKTKRYVIIKASLQEKITTRTEATWAPLTASAAAQTIFGGVVQYFKGRTLVSQYTSRRIWTGTTPLDFTLNLKFEAINDVGMEVLRPIVELQRMSLPFSGVGSEVDRIKGFFAKSFLAPPGPDPFGGFGIEDLKAVFKNQNYKPPETYEDITVHIGMIMEIKRVVVKDITIQQSPKFDEWGRPVEAIATVHFQTFEIMTKEDLDDIYLQMGLLSHPTEAWYEQQLTE